MWIDDGPALSMSFGIAWISRFRLAIWHHRPIQVLQPVISPIGAPAGLWDGGAASNRSTEKRASIVEER